ncbi:SEC-C motif-containing protein [Halolactibacillus halophilus]|uniref:Preprotein translocase subunit SecA n=1 Tax=Halolactibacillus halophilus TaxID=306540 RepID=A0A1I5LF35_9BACI|nr:SEC-C metal-binding domain-containing protein [Halolactibacillus halophilus]GEM00850.1 preprotein translocase subunit SecA [Halolactibacillus halophilus]SFO95910.1 SEC-C motif-containing protein [Halolactibacillus halophilus]
MSVSLQDFFTQLHTQRENTDEQITYTYKKLLKPQPVSSTQAAFLAQLTKKDLDTIRRWMDLEGVSKLTKQPLIECLTQEQTTAINRFILSMDNERLQWLKKFVAGEAIRLDHFTAHKLAFFTYTGLTFAIKDKDEYVLIMPDDVRRQFGAYDQNEWQIQADINDAIIRLTQGLLYYYGYMPKSTVFELVSPIVSYNLVRADAVIKDAKTYYDYMRETEQDLMDSRVIDLDSLKEQQQKSIYQKHYSFTDDQLIQAGTEDFMDLTDELIQLVKHLKERYSLDDQTMNRYMDDCLILLNSFIDIDPSFLYLSQQLPVTTEDDKKMLLALLQTSQDSIHTWALKGNKRKKDVNQTTETKKVGRNDPCPCGSGKKYKKCCGK